MHYQNYESEFSRFLKEWQQQHPEVVEEQRKGRLIFWDKPPLSPDELKQSVTSEVKEKSSYTFKKGISSMWH